MADELHTNLRRLMAARRLSGRRLSQEAGLNESAIRDILQGRSKNPRYDTLKKISDVLGVHVRQFIPIELQRGIWKEKFPDRDIDKKPVREKELSFGQPDNPNDQVGMVVYGIVQGINFSDANLTRASLIRSDLRWGNFARANLTNADFTGSDLRDAVFTDAILTETIFIDADLRGADFTGADLSTVIMTSRGIKNGNPP